MHSISINSPTCLLRILYLLQIYILKVTWVQNSAFIFLLFLIVFFPLAFIPLTLSSNSMQHPHLHNHHTVFHVCESFFFFVLSFHLQSPIQSWDYKFFLIFTEKKITINKTSPQFSLEWLYILPKVPDKFLVLYLVLLGYITNNT